jgi:hypothetical protein
MMAAPPYIRKAMIRTGIRIAHMEGFLEQMCIVKKKVQKSAQYAQGIDIIRATQRIDLTAVVSVEIVVLMTISCRLNV